LPFDVRLHSEILYSANRQICRKPRAKFKPKGPVQYSVGPLVLQKA